MRSSVPVRKAALLLGIAGGLAAFAVGVGLATAFLPEWRAGEPAEAALIRERYRQLAARAGFVPLSGEPRIFLTTGAGSLMTSSGLRARLPRGRRSGSR